jgi:hypothetical protein
MQNVFRLLKGVLSMQKLFSERQRAVGDEGSDEDEIISLYDSQDEDQKGERLVRQHLHDSSKHVRMREDLAAAVTRAPGSRSSWAEICITSIATFLVKMITKVTMSASVSIDCSPHSLDRSIQSYAATFLCQAGKHWR